MNGEPTRAERDAAVDDLLRRCPPPPLQMWQAEIIARALRNGLERADEDTNAPAA